MSSSVRVPSQVESLLVENALLERRIAEYLEGRNSLKASVAVRPLPSSFSFFPFLFLSLSLLKLLCGVQEAIQFLEDQCEQKRRRKEATKEALEEVKKERKALVDLLYSLEVRLSPLSHIPCGGTRRY